jgi:hypothetical protein
MVLLFCTAAAGAMGPDAEAQPARDPGDPAGAAGLSVQPGDRGPTINLASGQLGQKKSPELHPWRATARIG